MEDIKNKTMTEILVVFMFSCSLVRKRLRDLKMVCVSVSLNRWLRQFCKRAHGLLSLSSFYSWPPRLIMHESQIGHIHLDAAPFTQGCTQFHWATLYVDSSRDSSGSGFGSVTGEHHNRSTLFFSCLKLFLFVLLHIHHPSPRDSHEGPAPSEGSHAVAL